MVTMNETWMNGCSAAIRGVSGMASRPTLRVLARPSSEVLLGSGDVRERNRRELQRALGHQEQGPRGERERQRQRGKTPRCERGHRAEHYRGEALE
jgi:hypothetical protein